MSKENIITAIWDEDTDDLSEFACKDAYIYGYSLTSELVPKATYADTLYLMFKGELPSIQERKLLETFLVIAANPGPRDPSIHAAMSAGVGGSTAASALMAALAVGSGQVQGSRELFWCMNCLQSQTTRSVSDLYESLCHINYPDDTYPKNSEIPGFYPYHDKTEEYLKKVLSALASLCPKDSWTAWLSKELNNLEQKSNKGISQMLVFANVLTDLKLTPQQGEMLTLLARLPGAAVHSLEQIKAGYKNFPFYPLNIKNDPYKLEDGDTND